MCLLGEPSEYGIDLASFQLPACQQIQYLAMLPLVHGLALAVVTMPCPPSQMTHSWSPAAVYALCMLCLPGVASVIGRAARFRNGAACPMRRPRVQGMGVELKETQQESPVRTQFRTGMQIAHQELPAPPGHRQHLVTVNLKFCPKKRIRLSGWCLPTS